jgi:ElaB/YqjD/DUF883 family membrane-anchored ribosome-binding protein
MADETEVIREQMEETRTALTEKLEKLEQHLEDEVKGTVSAVADTVQSVTGAVQDTVSTVKETVSDTVEAVKGSVEETVETVKSAFDIRRHFDEHPWLTLAGCALAGYVGGCLLPRPPAALTTRMSEAGAGQPVTQPVQAPSPPVSVPSGPSWTETLAEAFAPAISKIKELAIGTTAGMLGEMILPSLPDTLRKEVGDALDQITTSLGGKPIPSFREHAESCARRQEQEQDASHPDGASPVNRISGMGGSL